MNKQDTASSHEERLRPNRMRLVLTERVWVFHAGQSAGPFTVDAFLKHTADERWPPHALTARENYTVWCTVGELRDSLAVNQLALN